METVATLTQKLDMPADKGVEWLRYMLFEVEGVDSVVTDQQRDLLIDVSEDPSVAERIREAKLKETEKAKQKAERLKEAAKKAAAKRKAKAKPAAEEVEEEAEGAEKKPKRKAAPRKRAAKAKEGEETAAVAVAPEALAEAAHPPVAEILPPEPGEAAAAAPAEPVKEKKKAPDIIIGSAIDRVKHTVEVVRADGTLVEAPEVEVAEEPAAVIEQEEEEEETGLLAEAERRQEEEERRKAKLAARALIRPDPEVVAEVKRRAAERGQKALVQRFETLRKVGVGKTARKKGKKADRGRDEDEMRRTAAAAVRGFQTAGPTGLLPKRRKRKRTREEEALGIPEEEILEKRVIEVQDGMTVESLANVMEIGVNDLILDLMDYNVLANKNQVLNLELIRRVAEARGFDVHSVIPEESELIEEEVDDPADLVPRPPVITVMGHVDHGKTTLLDRVRAANVAEGEAGGITQHIAAYDVPIGTGRVVFLDTPGHEAFTHMRARGAKLTDIVVLVIAADDGVMPQTIEAIDHAKAAEVPIVVAINKCDKPNAQPDRIRQELTRFELMDEQWGGKTIIKNIAAKTGEGVPELMELLVLQSELLELKGNPKRRARGAIIESELSRGQGPVAWVLVQNGTLRVGDVFLAGKAHGRVRALLSARGEHIQEAGPATPVLVLGFNSLPDAGDQFTVVADERVARAIAEKRAQRERMKAGQVRRHITLEDFHARLMAGEKHELNVVFKADVQGSVDVLVPSLAKLGNEQVRVRLVHSGVGGITESDVLLASASDAVVLGFHVTANAKVQKLAEQEGVDIRTYRVIYEAIDDVRRALEGMLTPETKEIVTGHAEVRAVFRSSAFGNIAGCYVQDGEVVRGAQVRLTRDDIVVYEGKIASLRRVKDDVRNVAAGFECGIKLENFEDVKVGDVIETYRIESIAQTLN